MTDWFAYQIKELWDFKWAALLLPLLFPQIRKWITYVFKDVIYFKLNELFCKLPFMRDIRQLKQDRIDDVALRQKQHDENISWMQKISADVLEIGRTAKRISSRQRNVENAMNIAKIEFDSEFNAVEFTNEFLNQVDIDKMDLLGVGYINAIYFPDRKMFQEQMEIVKKQCRENDFDIRISKDIGGFWTFHAKVIPILCIKKEFIGCLLTLTKQ